MSTTIIGIDAKRAREALGHSQTAVARSIGVNRTYYSLFEAGRYVLDDTEQQRLREFLADALADRGTAPEDGQVGGPARNPGLNHSPKRLRGTTTDAPACDPEEITTEAAEAALASLRRAAAEPSGLRTKRTASAVADVVSALQPLEYEQLLQVAEDRGVPTDALPNLEAFSALGLESMNLWESRATGLLVCDALYGGLWTELKFNALKGAESALRRTLGERVVECKELWFWEDEEEHEPLRRAELAPYVVQAAQKRAAPAIAKVNR